MRPYTDCVKTAGKETAVVEGPASDHSPVWVEDAARLVLLSNRTAKTGVWTVPVADGHPTDRPVEIEANVGECGMMGLARPGVLLYGTQISVRLVLLIWAGSKEASLTYVVT